MIIYLCASNLVTLSTAIQSPSPEGEAGHIRKPCSLSHPDYNQCMFLYIYIYIYIYIHIHTHVLLCIFALCLFHYPYYNQSVNLSHAANMAKTIYGLAFKTKCTSLSHMKSPQLACEMLITSKIVRISCKTLVVYAG